MHGSADVKVLFNTYPMAFHTPGGGEIQLLAYRDHLPRHGVGVTLFDPWKPRFLEHDLAHFFSCVGGSLHFCVFIRQIGLPLVVSSSLWITEETKHLYPTEEIRQQLDLADLVVANSDIECETLSRVLNLPRDKFATVYNGVDDLFFAPCSPDIFRRFVRIEERFILNVGNIEPRKNQLRLITAMKEFPDLKLILMGHIRDPLYADECLHSGGEQVRYVKAVPHDSPILRSAYSACEAFALPSALETPGLAALEAASLGCSVVVTEVGSAGEYFGDLAHYVDPANVKSIADGLAAALGGPKRMDKDAFVKKNYSWMAVTRKLREIYAGLLGETEP
jgi:glycosyltransferase involved in cell wall biosynthesis